MGSKSEMLSNKDIKELPYIELIDIAKRLYNFYPDSNVEGMKRDDVRFKIAYTNLAARLLYGRIKTGHLMKSLGLKEKVFYYYLDRHKELMKTNEHYRERVIKGTYVYLCSLNNKRKKRYEQELEKAEQDGRKWEE